MKLRPETLEQILDVDKVSSRACVKPHMLKRWVANVLAYLEHKDNFSRDDLVARLRRQGTQTTVVQLSYIFCGHREPSLEYQVAVAAALGIRPDDFYLKKHEFLNLHCPQSIAE